MNTLRKVKPSIEEFFSFKKIKPIRKAEDKNKVYHFILVRFTSFEQEVKKMKEKKIWQVLIFRPKIKM